MTLENCIQLLSPSKRIGSYFTSNDIFKSYRFNNEGEEKITQSVYVKLWKTLNDDYINDESKKVLKNLFERNNINLNCIKDKTVLDMGCGSGRFTIALSQLGASKVVGVDLGKTGIEIGHKMVDKLKLDNVTFLRESVLHLPFNNESFDFVFCKGVLHHTNNVHRGLSELHRVIKKGGKAYLYLYGHGGIFWYSRKRMREVMQKIPMEYTMKVLDLIGMPSQRYIFVDSWYVPIEDHVRRINLEELLGQSYSVIKKLNETGDYKIDSMHKQPNSKEIWGDGELRYFLTK